MDISQLEYFVTIAQMEHISRAAEVLNISQPALSASIRRLENELAVDLFTRKGRGIELNEAGRIFYDAIIPVLEGLDRAKLLVQEHACAASSEIVLVAPPLTSFPGLLQYVRASAPNLVIKNSYGVRSEMYEKLSSGRVDFCMSNHHLSGPGIESALLLDETLVVVAGKGHPLAGRSSVFLRELEDCEFAAYSEMTAVGFDLRAICQKSGFVPRITFGVTSLTESVEMIQQGRHIVLWPERLADQFCRGDLVRIEIADHSPEYAVKFKLFWHQKKRPSENWLLARRILIDYFAQVRAHTAEKKG